MNYKEVEDKFGEAEFDNVKTLPKQDLINGLIIKDGDVESVTIDGSGKFEANTAYRPDVEVIITYHTFKDKN